jgi:hypothetical protein
VVPRFVNPTIKSTPARMSKNQSNALVIWASLRSRLTLEFSGARSVPAATHCSAAWQPALRVLQLTQTPIIRKPLQLPSGSLFRTINLLPRICFTSPPADSTYEAVELPHSTAQPSNIVRSLVSGT